ncbi:MAG: Stk1 family PASTA domain-containing Ser/Thr kinase [Clostridiales bacterium]|nr:Stk1 family PASTA domain-containing Ser/Thr kinase [Clostridiales bacterium]
MVQIGMILGGRYEILEHIGSGGMADVYKAKCCDSKQYVAVKILRSEYSEDATLIRRFTTEARSTSGLHHPNVVSILDEGNDQGIHYIVMELAEGMTLKRYIRRYGRLSVRETVDFAIQIAEGIQAAHQHNIVHRDIKPQNIIVSDSGKLKVTDFGIAKAATGDTIASSTMGSVRYLSPEQARGGYSDSRSDIYSLGITIYEMATGKVPFDGENTVTIALMHLRDDITPPRNYFPDIPVSLENIILKCTRKRPEERYQTAGELIQDLRQVFTSPDGNYVYTNIQVDDSPTRTRTAEEIEQVKQSLGSSVVTDNGENLQGESDSADAEEDSTEDNPEDNMEDEEDDASMNPKLEKMIMGITIVFGILLACLIIYVVGTSTNLLPFFSNNSSESSTEASTSAAEETAEEETQEEIIVYTSVPDFLGMTKSEARAEAEEYSLKVTFTYEDGVDESDSSLVVVEQQYEEGESVAEGTKVKLTMGQNEDDQQIEVPALVNYTEEEAREVLEALGLEMESVYANSDTVEAGYVIRQSPKGGSLVDKGFTITVTVSKGVSQVQVPSLYGQSQAAAEQELNHVGLVLGSVSSDYSGSVGVGDVIEQSIDSGTYVDKGTAVSIVVSLGEPVTYHYEGTVTVEESPFEEDETGMVELILNQGDSTETIYTNQNATETTFPLDVSFESESNDEATVTLYVNGEEYDSYDVEWNAVAD